jgi:cell division initiation protein
MTAMDVTPQELRSSEIKDSWRGYDRDEVDDLLERAAVTIESLTQQLQESHSRPSPAMAASPVPVAEAPLPATSRDDAEILQRTLLMAQRAADDAVNEAQARARQMLEESESKAQALVSDAEATARRIAEGERRRLEAELLELSSRRDQLRADADALDEYVSGYRDRIRAAVERDLSRLTAGDVEAPGERPELHEVEIPVITDTAPVAAVVADAEPVAEAPAPAAPTPAEGGSWDDGPATRALGQVESALQSTSKESASKESASSGAATTGAGAAANPPSEPAAPAWPPPAPEPRPAAAEGGAGSDSWLESEGDWATSATAWDAPAPWEREGASPESYSPDVTMEANSIDSDSLDDDAFFASLREAVSDDAPLGPRDDEVAHYENQSEADRRRFHRRR